MLSRRGFLGIVAGAAAGGASVASAAPITPAAIAPLSTFVDPEVVKVVFEPLRRLELQYFYGIEEMKVGGLFDDQRIVEWPPALKRYAADLRVPYNKMTPKQRAVQRKFERMLSQPVKGRLE